jgi:hypothetical protein
MTEVLMAGTILLLSEIIVLKNGSNLMILGYPKSLKKKYLSIPREATDK